MRTQQMHDKKEHMQKNWYEKDWKLLTSIVSSGKYLPEGYNSEEPQKANNEKESNHPWQGRILNILIVIRYSRLFGDSFAHTKKVTSEATWEFNRIVQKTQ